MFTINDGIVATIELLSRRPILFRLDVFPFVTAFTGMIIWLLFTDGSTYGWFYGALVVVGQLLIVFASTWSLDFQSFLGFVKSAPLESASSVLIKAAPNAGKDKIVTIQCVDGGNASSSIEIAGAAFHLPTHQFEFQKVMYQTHKGENGSDDSNHRFFKRQYPIHQRLEQYLCHGGFGGGSGDPAVFDAQIEAARRIFGRNEFDIPLPSFPELYVEHLLAPFFMFQVICLILWSLDDYWYYSVMTLALLMFFEAMQCKQRMNSLQMLRNMRQPAYPIFVFRNQTWSIESTLNLLPGDIISITSQSTAASRPKLFLTAGANAAANSNIDDGASGRLRKKKKFEPLVPCDVLLLQGTCICNEAMLTGESIPQIKEPIAACWNEATREVVMDIRDEEGTGSGLEAAAAAENNAKNADKNSTPVNSAAPSVDWKRHIVCGGTTVMLQQHNGPTRAPKGAPVIPLPPDGGATGMVLRTGYGTTQGGLMRKILFATERVNAYSMETVYFIVILVLIAIGASGVVLYYSYNDPTRDRYKLLLHCIMIVTSVVPPELPMELSLSVTNSLAALSHFFIFCTEPYRIPFAGRLSVLCFDKTGTLTKDKLLLKGIVAPIPSPGDQDDSNQVVDNFSFQNFIDNVPYKLSGPSSSRSRGGASSGSANGGACSIGRDDDIGDCSMGAVGFDDVPSQMENASSPQSTIYAPESCSDVTRAIMASCHSIMDLSSVGKGIVGDPMELVTLEASGFGVLDQNTVCGEQNSIRIRTLLRYPFSSTLKRMSVIAHCSGMGVNPNQSGANPLSCCFLFVKGAPEVLAPRIKHLPPHYQATYTYHMSRGKRVIALCYRPLNLVPNSDSTSPSKPNPSASSSSSSSSSASTISSYSLRDISSTIPRETMENGLIFAGFVVYDCDLKPDTKAVIKELRQADHHIVIITGDSVHTATDVGRKIGIIGKSPSKGLSNNTVSESSKVLILHPVQKGDSATQPTLVWRNADQFVRLANEDTAFVCEDDVPFSADADSLSSLSSNAKLCVTGSSLDSLLNSVDIASSTDLSNALGGSNASKIAYLSKVCRHVTIFARVAPLQKELVVQAYNAAGDYTLMCGDGTNDVGALKAAHVGVSVINDVEFEANVEESINNAGNSSAVGVNAAAKRRLDRAMVELQAQQQDSTVVKLGDASIASPFTARRTSIDVVLSLLKQGRCTLVTTIQVYKILALSCLATAFTMSFLYLNGLKQGDTQMTVTGLTMAGLFFVISQAKPLPRLSSQKPPSSVFAPSVFLSIAGQCAVHMACLYLTSTICKHYYLEKQDSMGGVATASTETVDAEDFSPNIVNTAVFLVAATIQVNNFVINYHGHPYMQSLSENTLLYRAVVGMYAVLLVLVGGQVEPLNDLFQLVNFGHLRLINTNENAAVPLDIDGTVSSTVSGEFQGYLLTIMFSSAVLGYGIEYLCRKLE